jgi:5-hydroxyisourate hydrolase-like protein (transthyretin family)
VINLLRAFVTPLVYCLLASTTVGRLARRTLCTAVAISAALLGQPAPNAAAGVFEVASCQADSLSYSTRAFTHFATRRMMIKRACNPEGPGLRGLITANVVHDGRVKRGSIALVAFTAPPGTRMTTFRWAGTARRRDCRFALQLWADAPGIPPITIKNVRANRRCPSPGRAQAAGYRAETFDVSGATRIVQRVVCVGKDRRNWCSGRGRNYIRTFTASVGIVDDLPPAVEILPDTPLATGAWVSGTQPLNYTASDNVGVRVARAVIGERERGVHARACVLASLTGPFADPLPCPNGPGQIIVRTHELPAEGTQQLAVEATDSAGNSAASVPVTTRIDNTPPSRVAVSVDGGETWRNRNDWAVVWTNPAEGDRAPITAATYALCPAGATNCSRGVHAEVNVSRLPVAVPQPGEWTLSVWRRDAAGNEAEDNASVPVTLRYDPAPPQLAFEPAEAADPTLVAVRVTDQVSGLADGVIEIGAVGSGVWQTLATQKDGSRLVTRIDDAALPAGAYVLRARARDQAGNEASTDRRDDGQPMVITLPLRTPVTLRAGFERTIRRQGKRRREIVLRRAARVGFLERARIAGRLATGDGRAITGALVQVLSRAGAEPEQLVETLTTDADGRFRSVATGTSSRALRLVYGGSSLTLPSQAALKMRVPAATSVRVSRRRLRNGQRVTFNGRVRGLPVPAAGKLVEVQVRFSDRWQTFRTTRSDATGRWSSRYRFQRTRGVQLYHFRIRLPEEGGYPFETSVSRTLVVQVTGR